jgi:hypothetical protein
MVNVLVFLPHNPRNHPHDGLVNCGEELDNDVSLSAHRAKDSPKYEAKKDNSKGINAGPEINAISCLFIGLDDDPLSSSVVD